jgi:hypothetical protein
MYILVLPVNGLAGLDRILMVLACGPISKSFLYLAKEQ